MGLGPALFGVKGQRQGSEIAFKIRIQSYRQESEASLGDPRLRVESTKEAIRSHNSEGKGQTLRSEIIVWGFFFFFLRQGLTM